MRNRLLSGSVIDFEIEIISNVEMVERQNNFPVKAFLSIWIAAGLLFCIIEIVRLRDVVSSLKEENNKLKQIIKK